MGTFNPRIYATAVLTAFVLLCLGALGLRWHANGQNAAASQQVPGQPFARSQPKASPNASQPAPGTATPASAQDPPLASSAADAASSTGDADSQRRAAEDAHAPQPASVPADTALQPLLSPPPARSSPPRDAAAVQFPIDINTAVAAEFNALPGIGEVLAQRILDYRTAHGRFKSVAELDNVKGIGPKILQNISKLVVCGKAK